MSQDNAEIPTKSDEAQSQMDKGMDQLRLWLNKWFRIKMTDGRILIGVFLCTDRDANIILGSCTEHLPPDDDYSSNSEQDDEPRMLGLVMVPGRYIETIEIDLNDRSTPPDLSWTPPTKIEPNTSTAQHQQIV